ncbi:MAG: ArnT family glycosyltransferase, partial [Fusobacteriaceae bacterium]
MKFFKLENSDSKKAYLYLGILYMILFIPLIFLRYPDLRNEFKYLIIAQDMIDSKNYLIMRYFGELYPDKPPIYFWILIFFKKYSGNLA